MSKNNRLLVCLLAACAMAGAATRPEMLVSTEWLAAHASDADVVILHVSANRTAYDAGHIPGARYLAQADLVVTRDGVTNELPAVADLKRVLEAAGVSDGSRVVLYGDTSVLPATRAYFTLDYLGLGDRAALLDGGLEKWRSEGRALSKEAPAAKAGQLTPRPKPELVVSMDAVKQMTPASGTLLDVRPATDFSGEKGGHIPGAKNLYWMETQASRENQSLKSETELLKLYQTIGLSPGQMVVAYCNSGMQATQSYFTLKYLGFATKLFDGSMSEWNAKGGALEK